MGIRETSLAIAFLIVFSISTARSQDDQLSQPGDAFFLELAETDEEVIYVFSERKEKPFERDTELRITQNTMRERSIASVADALALLPDIRIRAAGRGGQQVDIRGARKGSVKILIDGVPISDPFFGNIDLASIPVTDIVQVRVSKLAASPIDGVGGPGGVVEIHTRDAVGHKMAYVQVQGKTVPEGLASATARIPLSDRWALRGSATARLGRQTYSLPLAATPRSLDEERDQYAGALRLEYRSGIRRLVGDLYAQKQSFVAPPDAEGNMIRVTHGEERARAALSFDDGIGSWKLQARGYLAGLTRDSSLFTDAELQQEAVREDLTAFRAGATLLANRELAMPADNKLELIGSAAFDYEDASQDETRNGNLSNQGGNVSTFQGAIAVHFERGPLVARGSVGGAIPLGINANPWPEFKLTTEYQVLNELGVKLAVGRKGRVPTLRERFGLAESNRALGPEQALYGELEIDFRPQSWFRVRAVAFDRETNGTIRVNPATGRLFNTGDLSVRGTELVADLGALGSTLNGGASWTFTKASSALLGSNALDFLPAHRLQAWLRASAKDGIGGTLRLFWDDEQIDRNAVVPSRGAADLSAYAPVGRYLFTARLETTLSQGRSWTPGENYVLRTGVFAPGATISVAAQATWQ